MHSTWMSLAGLLNGPTQKRSQRRRDAKITQRLPPQGFSLRCLGVLVPPWRDESFFFFCTAWRVVCDKGFSLKRSIRILLIAFLLATVPASRGQLLTTHLQGNSVTGFAYEDSSGHLLFATSTGLWRFDGKDFSRISIRIASPNNSGTVPVDPGELVDVLLDHDKRIWLGSQTQGLFIQNGSIWQHLTSDSGAPSNNITDLFVDSFGKIWIGTADQGVGIFDGQRWHRIKVGEYDVFKDGQFVVDTTFATSRGPRDNQIYAVHEDTAKGIWIGSKLGARRFSGGLNRAGMARRANWCNCLDNENVLSFANDRTGKIWAGTEGHGVFLVNPGCTSGLAPRCTTPDTLPIVQNPLRNKIIHHIEVDQEGNLWFGTNDGICRYNPPANSLRCLNENDFPGLRTVKKVFTDPDNNLWFGLLENLGAVRLNNNWFTFDLDSLPNSFVLSLLAIKDTLWVGTANGVRRFKGERRLGADVLPGNRAINALALAENSQVWVGTYGGGVYLFDRDGNPQEALNLGPLPCNNQVNQIIPRNGETWMATDGRLSRRLRDGALKHYESDASSCFAAADKFNAIAFDAKGLLWCGTPLGVKVLDSNSERWVAAYTTANGLFGDNNVTALAVDPRNGEVWIGTASGGISIYNGATWKHVDSRAGLADNLINEVAFSSSGEVFVATPRGVNRRDKVGIWSTFDFQSGLASDNVAAIALQADSLRWFGTYGAGLTRYRPPQSRPQTFLETRLDVTDKAEVTYFFAAADLNTAPNEFRYRYALDDTTKWSQPRPDRVAIVPVLKTGPHTFYVQAIDRDGNTDPMPATDFFYKINPDSGGYARFERIASFPKIGAVTLRIYWPPYKPVRDADISIAPVHPDSLAPSALFAFDLNPPQIKLSKPAILTFSFISNQATQGKTLSIYQEQPRLLKLGGTFQTGGGRDSLSTAIQELSRYSVRIEEAFGSFAALKDSVKVNAQPRAFSPAGGGHGAQTTLSFKLDKEANVRISVFNLAGRLVDTIWDAPMSAGINAVAWDGRDRQKRICPSGLYLIVINSNGFKSPPQPVKVMVTNE